MPDLIRVASPSDMKAIAVVMDNGFAGDPTVKWAAATKRDFETAHHRFVELCARPAFPAGGVHVFADFSGAAIWYPPGTELDTEELADVFSKASRPDRIASFFKLLEACEDYRPKEPYWELELLAVDPSSQGNGLGSKLLDYGLAICDRENAQVYLESSNPANLTFYRRHGFELLAEVGLPGTPKRYPMVRGVR